MKLVKESEFKQYVELLQSMCLDLCMGGISPETFVSNLEMITPQIRAKCFDAEESTDE